MSGDPLAGATPELLLKTASDVVRKVQKRSTFFDPQREAVFPHFDMNGKLSSSHLRSVCEII
jgi:hypothetical protein